MSRRRVTVLWALAGIVAAAWYFGWLLTPGRSGVWWLFAALVAADLFNGFHALSFWATCLRRVGYRPYAPPADVCVDVLVPTYGEPLDVLRATVSAATRMHGAERRVWLLDDARRDEVAALADELGVRYLTRERHRGAKAGNLNDALAATADDGCEYVCVFDADHAPRPEFLARVLGWFADPRVGLVQTPQRYANTAAGPLTRAAAEQQAIFFGPISRGRDGWGAAICCGTNFVARRDALASAGGFPEDSLTEDIALSARLTSLGWRLVYDPRELADGLGPEDARSYLSQQRRWAVGCLDLLLRRRRLLAGLPLAASWQYLVATSYWLTGWTILVYLSLPIARLVFGLPVLVDPTGAFAVHFLPYFLIAVVGLGRMTGGGYTWRGLVLNWGSFTIGVRATLAVVLRRQGGFAVTSKRALQGTPWRLLWPNAIAGSALIAASAYATAGDPSPAVLGNVSFAVMGAALVTPIVGFSIGQARRARRSLDHRADAAAPAPQPDRRSLVRDRGRRRGAPPLAGTRGPQRCAAAVAVGLLGTLAGIGAALAVASAGAPAPHAAPADDGTAVAAGRRFLARYVGPKGRVLQNGEAASERQARAMLIAVALRDEAAFRRVWRWTRTHLRRPDELFAGRWSDGRVVDRRPLAAADLDVARALLVAAGTFDRSRHARAAVRIGEAVRREETIVAERGRPVLAAGPWARRPRLIEPGSFAPRTTGLLWRATGDGHYASLVRSMRVTAADLLTLSPYRPPDRATVDARGRATPAPAPDGGPAAYGPGAQRLPLRFAESCAPADRALAGRLWPILRNDAQSGRLPLRYAVDGSRDGRAHPVAWAAAAAAASAAGDRAARDRLLDRAEAAERAAPSADGAAWVALARLMLQTGRLQGCALQALR
jgi:cellulose synthase (UDP-forming)